MDSRKQFVQMGIEPDEIIFYNRILKYIVAGECLLRLHPEELEVKVHRPKRIINASTAKENPIRIIERFQWRIISQ
jgi:hypothetical protein